MNHTIGNNVPMQDSKKVCIDKATQLLDRGKIMLERLDVSAGSEIEDTAQKKCIGANLHRGFFHPSPIYDLVIGNVKRGRLVDISAANGELTHLYFYNQQGALIRVESWFRNRLAYTEHLIYEPDRILGVTCNHLGILAAVSEEMYVQGILRSFSPANFHHLDNLYSCFELRMEDYCYDKEGLSACKMRIFSPGSDYLIDKQYSFRRDNGFLTLCIDENPTSVQKEYPIRRKRKAQPTVHPVFRP